MYGGELKTDFFRERKWAIVLQECNLENFYLLQNLVFYSKIYCFRMSRNLKSDSLQR